MERTKSIDNMICENCLYADWKKGICTIHKEFDPKKASQPNEPRKIKKKMSCADFTESNQLEGLNDAYENIIDLLRKYCDLNEKDYPLVAIWIIGTYFHKQFQSYPYLYLNAMKGSGKTRTLKLITGLSYNGEILLRPTEAVLFRTTSTLGIDEAEGLSRKGMEDLIELLNGCYKKGSKVKRMKQKRTETGMEQVVEEFEIYRPLILANINGVDEVLGDRCISIILERSENKGIIKLAEIWEEELIFQETKEILKQCMSCSVCVAQKAYTEWNNYVVSKYINNTHNYIYTTYTHYTELFKRLDLMDLTGRDIELCLPLLLLGWEIGKKIFENVYEGVLTYTLIKKEEQFNESLDVSLIDYVSQEIDEKWKSIKEITNKFKEFLQSDDPDINPKWIGVALKRLNLRKQAKRKTGGMYIILDVNKAQEKIKMFK